MRPLIVGLSWLLGPAARRLDRALRDPESAQAAIAANLARTCATTAFGRDRGLDGTPGALAKLEPSTWADVAPFAELEREGQAHALAPGPVVTWETTSGSGGRQKHVPYTQPMMAVFRRMFSAWAHDVIREGPRLERGRFYFSISPSLGSEEDHALEDDADYLAGWQRTLMGPWFVRPKLGGVHDGEAFKDATCLALLTAADLEIVSVWSPTFLTMMLDHLKAQWTPLVEHLATSAPRRHAALIGERAMPAPTTLWPALKLVSCWADGSATAAADALRTQLGDVRVQGKGLLATEGPVTIPRIALDDEGLGQVPLVSDVLIELLDDGGDVVPLTSAEEGQQYEVLLSTPGGLLRYRLGDVVEVRGRAFATPLLRLVGRADAVSDLVGEKLAEAHVAEVLAALLPDRFATLVPAPSGRRYVLLTDGEGDGLDRRLDAALREAFHYRQARELGQLLEPTVVSDRDASARLLEAWQRSGRKAGDLKPSALVRVPLSLDREG